MTHRPIAVLLAVLVALAGVAAGAAAQEPSIWDSFTEDSDDDSIGVLERVYIANAEIAAVLDKIQYRATGLTDSDPDPDRATKYANSFATTYAEHNETLEPYVNARYNGTEASYDVIALEFTVDGEEETRYLVAETNASTGNFTSSQVVNETDRTVDHRVGFEDYAAKNAASELDYFATEYAAEDRDIDTALVVRMGKRYRSDITLPEEVEWP